MTDYSSSFGAIVLYEEPNKFQQNEEENDFRELMRSLYETLIQYHKDFKTKGSWVFFYSDLLSIKFPEITFDETKHRFEVRVIKILDLMELSYLYCKVANSAAYDKNNHENVISIKTFVTSQLAKLSLQKFDELRLSLKNAILCGNN